MKKILIVAAHADDEVLGCAGTIAKHVAMGDSVDVVFMADGVGSRANMTEDALKTRNRAAEKMQKVLGVQQLHFCNFNDNRMDGYELLDIVKSLEVIVAQIKPEIIYTHHIGDLNIDHQITHKAVLTACRPQPGYSVRAIYAFEVVSSTEWQTPGYLPFLPTVFNDISAVWNKKMQAIECYAEEMREQPHARSVDNITALATMRGHSVGVHYVEAFMLIREIQ